MKRIRNSRKQSMKMNGLYNGDYDVMDSDGETTTKIIGVAEKEKIAWQNRLYIF
ncbi:hypothetical protein ACLIBH_13475 [Virgibacillus sp. W0430]|uniref:hypothetical protein n=1 Tax=Virgibacillus sp. W0430 TaxID=3391580 RepID=UPI003F481E16